MRFGRALAILCLLGAASAHALRAEVSARTDESGSYQCMTYKYSISSGSLTIWGIQGQITGRKPLNPTGDTIGDLVPTVAENAARGNWPLAIWSRKGGGDFDLVYASWEGTAWSPTRAVHGDNPFNDLEPRVAFSPGGRAYLVWWSDEGGVGGVYFSALANSIWLPPHRISTFGIDSRHPTLTVQGDNTVRVSFETPQGTTTRNVTLVRQDTITDDIDPRLQYVILISY